MRFNEPLGLKRSKAPDGTSISGLWESEIVRMELVDELWRFQVPMREVGKTGYYEFRPLDMGGNWHAVGSVKQRARAVAMAKRLQDGTHVYRGPYSDDLGLKPGELKVWTEVAAEIAAHPSVTGD